MKLGPMLLIGDTIYGVEYRTRFPCSRLTQGMCDYYAQRILIKRGQKPTEHLDTAIHEMLHAITEVYEDEMKQKGVRISHATIYFLADKLSKLVSDNYGVELEEPYSK